jgi:hypothetical protein
MEDFKVLKVSFNTEDFQESLEDQFFTTKIINSCKKMSHRQGIIRGLCMRLARLECQTEFNINNYSDFINELSNESDS